MHLAQSAKCIYLSPLRNKKIVKICVFSLIFSLIFIQKFHNIHENIFLKGGDYMLNERDILAEYIFEEDDCDPYDPIFDDNNIEIFYDVIQ